MRYFLTGCLKKVLAGHWKQRSQETEEEGHQLSVVRCKMLCKHFYSFPGINAGQLATDHGLRTIHIIRTPYELPIRIPARNTSAPPTTTWNAAARKGVSM